MTGLIPYPRPELNVELASGCVDDHPASCRESHRKVVACTRDTRGRALGGSGSLLKFLPMCKLIYRMKIEIEKLQEGGRLDGRWAASGRTRKAEREAGLPLSFTTILLSLACTLSAGEHRGYGAV